jgi:ribonuclease BN (tRNA processing enzyme)
MELVVLGSGGWVPTSRRATTCMALRLGDGPADDLWLFDAGTGLARLGEARFRRLIPQAGTIHLWLSHLHLDHTVGLTFIAALWRNPTVIHVPAFAAAEFGPDVLERLVSPPFYPRRLSQFELDVKVEFAEPTDGHAVPIDVAPPMSIREQRHPGGSLGFRVGDALALLTDTAYDPRAAEFVRGVKVLVHEAWSWEEDGTDKTRESLTGHTSAEDAARVAREAGVGELLLGHLSPLKDDEYHAEMRRRAQAIHPRTDLCEDGLVRSL